MIRVCIILIYPLPTVATYSLLVLVTIMPVFFGLSWFVTGQEGPFQLVTARIGRVHRHFRQVDVFTEEPFLGNPVAVVHGADDLTNDEMRRFANWTNLSETTFLLTPADERADYRVRIFTPERELPFAGHPTLGTAHAWLEEGGPPARQDMLIQECGVGLVPIRRSPHGHLAFKAPPLIRSGPVDAPAAARRDRRLPRHQERRHRRAQWADNGPGWVAVELASADAVLALAPGVPSRDIGVF